MRRSLRLAATLLLLGGLLPGCAKKDEGGPVPPARNEELPPATLSMLQSQFATHKQQWDDVMRGSDSPLPEEMRASFAELGFYPYAPTWRFVGDLERYRPPKAIQLPDNRGKSSPYFEYGSYPFLVRGDTLRLIVYRPFEHPEQYFIAFADSTSGIATYGGGRYVHLDSLDTHKFVLDFNKAYNPYCAYDSTWICPLPPRENWLPVAIEAGMLDVEGH
ncbi:MAG: DUF1684 domain-containing protein [Candidatus Eiseniibacteriota bacterium]